MPTRATDHNVTAGRDLHQPTVKEALPTLTRGIMPIIRHGQKAKAKITTEWPEVANL